ncbi:hypothetical protein Lal_00011237 [Lupinus albus]|nr:hypothetical protein Lal_00011237 [Lupinus albus]
MSYKFRSCESKASSAKKSPSMSTLCATMSKHIEALQNQMEQLRLEFERKPPKREAKIKVPSFIGKIDP